MFVPTPLAPADQLVAVAGTDLPTVIAALTGDRSS